MIGKVVLPLAAAAVAVSIAIAVVFAAGWVSEGFGHLAANPTVVKFLRPVALAISPLTGMMGVFIALTAARKYRKAAPDEPMRPRIRNGLI
ncbi:MAG TPA: hypothetical protein VGG10_08625 [Rhizomicrobium sp.]|jgi:hypothetical protein